MGFICYIIFTFINSDGVILLGFLKEVLGFLSSPGGVVIFIAVCVVLVIFIFRKPLESFFRTLIKVKFRGLEMEAVGESSERSSDINSNNSLIEPEKIDSDEKAPSLEISSTVDSNNDISSDDYLKSLIDAFKIKDKTKLKMIYQDFMKNETDKISKIKLKAIYYSLLYRLGEDVISFYYKIEKEAENTEAYPNVMLFFADSFADTKDNDRAKIYLEKGIHNIGFENTIRGILFERLSSIYVELGDFQKAVNLLLHEINRQEVSDENKFEYYYHLANLYRDNDNLDFQIYALEKAVKIKPNHKSALFSLAYAYSKINYTEMAVFYYEKILLIDNTDKSVMNNLGVVYSKLKMNYKSIEYYEKSSNLGNTLATANLAYSYMNSGFIDKAEEILQNVKGNEDVHQNVNSALLKVQRLKKEEEDKKTNKIESAKEIKDFFNNLASATFEKFSINSQMFDGSWILNGDESITEIVINQSQISIILETKKLVGNFINRHITFELYERKHSIVTQEYQFEKNGQAVGYISIDGGKINILDYNKDGSYKIYVLEKK
ncbi:tetratricopeptide repeat protein [Bacillus sp. 'calajunan']